MIANLKIKQKYFPTANTQKVLVTPCPCTEYTRLTITLCDLRIMNLKSMQPIVYTTTKFKREGRYLGNLRRKT